MNLAEEQFSEKHHFPLREDSSKTLIIASTPRSGSHMLGHALYATGCFGFPLEYAHPGNLTQWEKRLGTAGVDETLHEIRRRRTSHNGVFGIKIHYSHIREFGGFEQVKAFFPDAYYVFLRREDALKQAVSYVMARQTGVWISGQPTDTAKVRYDFDAIDSHLKKTLRENAAWRYLLVANGCKCVEMNFSAMVKDLPAAVRKVGDFMGVEVPSEKIPVQSLTQRQDGTLGAEWMKRYLEDKGAHELWDAGLSTSVLKQKLKERLKPLTRHLAGLKSWTAALLLALISLPSGIPDAMLPGWEMEDEDGRDPFVAETTAFRR
jgi:LPS sulfotransferase NodH